jgi:general secretion pathway protein H
LVTVAKIRTSRVAGFTLLELLVVLTIAGLLIALVPPAISSVVPGARLKVATRDFALTLRQARHLAITRIEETDVIIATEPPQYVLAGSNPVKLSGNIDLDVRVGAFVAVTQLSTFVDALPRDKFTLRFYPDGSASGGEIKFSQGRSAYLVDVDWLLGSVTVSKAPNDAY